MQVPKLLMINGQALCEVASLVLSQSDGRERWRITLALSARDKSSLSEQRRLLEEVLAAPIQSASVIQGDFELRAFDGAQAAIVAESLQWKVQDEERLAGTSRGELVLSQAQSLEPRLASWTRSHEREGTKARIVVTGHASGAGAQSWIAGLREREGTPIEERVAEALPDGRIDFRFVFADTSLSNEGAIVVRESIEIRQAQRVVTHLPLASNALPIRQLIGAPSIEAEQSGEARGTTQWPKAQSPRWPTNLIEQSSQQVSEGETRVTKWRYRFLFDTNPIGSK